MSDEERVTRSVEVEAGTDDVWLAISDPERRALWLDDDDARARRLRIDEVEAGRRLVWTWWPADDESGGTEGGAGASTVEVVLAPTVAGTRVTVTETAPIAPRATAGVRSGSRWGYRLLGLELLFVAAGALVG
jgi:uncharacterized protein YndB with AHSA1/START domain